MRGKIFDFDAWVKKCIVKHQGKYKYLSDKRIQCGTRWKLPIHCPEHGEFLQLTAKHASGQGCPKCSGRITDNLANLRSKFKSFDWSDVQVKDTKTPVRMVCPEHGEFYRTPNDMLNMKSDKTPCQKCNRTSFGVKSRLSHEEIVSRLEEKYGDSVSIDLSTVTLSNKKAKFTCKEHGEFWSILYDVLCGHGCYACGVKYRTKIISSTFSDFLLKARKVHGDRYSYVESTYTNVRTPMLMVCKEHGEFWQIPRNHTSNGTNCPTCSLSVSSGENEIADVLAGILGSENVLRRDRSVLVDGENSKGKELDIYIPSLKLGVEYCGLYWHGEFRKPGQTYHKAKLELANENGVKLLTIFEDEWLNCRGKVIARLMAHTSSIQSIYARNTEVRTVEWAVAKQLLDENHMQCSGRPTRFNYGLFHADELVAVATFDNSRFDKSSQFELFRYCSIGSIRVVGGIGKLFAAFVKDNNPESVMTYADLRWGSGNAYERLGFVKTGMTQPGYFWCKGTSRFNRYDFQKHKLAKRLPEFDADKTEVENCHSQGYWRIYDCGHAKYRWCRSHSL